MKRICGLLVFVLSCTSSGTALREDASVIEQWGRDPVLVSAVAAQNAQGMTLDQIRAIDARWASHGEEARAAGLTSGAAASRLRELMTQRGYGEAFLMDAQGALVAATQRTSDYWQGDEPKWQRSFNGGAGGVLVEEPRFDESANAVLSFVSVAVRDGDRVVGALTVGIRR